MLFEKLRWKTRAWKYKNRIDPGEIAFLIAYLKPGDLAVDIGAYKGAYTYWMSQAVGSQGQVVAFEANPERAETLAKLTKTKGNITVENMGVSSESGSKVLAMLPKNPQEASYETPIGDSHVTFETQTTTLDQYFLERNAAITFIKCDVEGHELSVFKGAQKVLTEDRPALLFECENRHLKNATIHDVFHFLQDIGYRGYFFEGLKRRPLAQLDEDVIRPEHPNYIYNYLFLSETRAA